MQLIIHQMVKFQHIHGTDRNGFIKGLACSAVIKGNLAGRFIAGELNQSSDFSFAGTHDPHTLLQVTVGLADVIFQGLEQLRDASVAFEPAHEGHGDRVGAG